MDTFLKQIARRIVADHPQDTDQVLVVFNNNRSKRFFDKEFSSMGQAAFLPQVKTIDELISDLTGLTIVSGEFLLFELYRIHVQIGGDDRKYQSFEDFIPFGELMMNDFSEIDQYCVDAAALFDNLHKLQSVGQWDISGAELTDFQKKYLEFYRSLYRYYSMLHDRLRAVGKSYGGMAYRIAAEEIEVKVGDCPYSDIYFVGFNALSRCEETLIKAYIGAGKGHLLTDSDIYYTEPAQKSEAGYFLGIHAGDFPELNPAPPSCFETFKKEIYVVDCPENILQSKFAGQLLADHPEWLAPEEAERTAVVLADEKLLIPMLGALPDIGKKYNVNVTMGYAYADSLVHAMAMKLFSLYRQQASRGFYHSNVVEVLADHFVGRLIGKHNLRRTLEYLMRKDSRIRCNADEIGAMLQQAGVARPDSVLFLFPDEKPSPERCVALLRQMARAIVGSGQMEDDNKEKQAMGSLAEILDNLDELLSTYPDTVGSTETLEKVYSRIAVRHSISLIGDPLTGLQILGMLETRNLDFKRVILLSTNEGILPGGRSGNSTIPFVLKRDKRFLLPTYVEKDKVFAYHFYRLLQRANEVYLVYCTESEAMGKGEPSRFVRQVMSELAPRFNIKMHRLTVKVDTALAPASPRDSAVKSPAVMQRLEEMGTDGLAPTSFSDYVECPLKYYYTRVLKTKENENVDESLDAAQLGSCIHAVLETVYGAHIGRPLQASALEQALQNLPALMDEAFEKLYAGGRNTEGRNRFLFSVAESQLRHILKQEKEQIEKGDSLVMRGVEVKMDLYPITPSVNIKGTIDRVDEKNGCLRIVDYKTGSLVKSDIKYEGKTIHGKWLQLMWYTLLYWRHAHPAGSVVAGIYPLRNLNSDVCLASWKLSPDDDPHAVTDEKMDLFEEMLRDMVEELMNPDIPFVATPSDDACRYCAVRTFCASKK
ncbi:MAG: PD-(D/E)XK nuclease family protein [Bacteroidales bacterium]|nr:PD-(D/E)XK nuclease family protein [Bacteroidales bacterium]